jgi:hypothetical protein
MPGAALDAAEFLDVDVDQLARAFALIALRRLQPEPAELAHPDPRQDARDRGQRPIEHLGNLGPGEAQPAQRRDRLDRVLVGAVGHAMWRRGAIEQPELAFGPVARDPLRARALADFGRLGGLRQRPPVLNHSRDHPLALSQ